ncbi:RNA-directed DNA polymerase from mobile element jockey-like isoform X1 [Rhizophagus irregularis DAOM 181602=DAOM 197198]|nr:RNA-directed DNA polymerase from mobile element jockey-like isoform X1 [Rhizophagus irregularis DAOM 181602=DAOM 197198]
MMNDNIDYDTFVRNPPTPLILVIFLMILYLILYFLPLPLLLPYSFNISSFNVNGLKTPGQGSFKMDQISSFFLQNHISFGGIVDTHLSPKQMKFLSKRVCDYTSFHSDLDSTKHGRSSGGVSLFIHNSLATHVQFYQSHSSRILFVDLFFKGNVKLRIFVVYIPPTNDLVLRYEVIDQIISLISQTSSQNFHHAICGTYHHLDTITRIDFVWSCPLLRQYILTASIFDAHDLHISDHNPIITYFDVSLLSDAIKSARARQLGRNTQRGFKYDSISTEQWTVFADDLDILCPIDPLIFDAWPLNQKCEYLHSRIIKAANSTLPSVTVGNTYVPKKPKDLDSLCQSYRFLSKVAKTIRSLHKTPISYSMHYETKWSSYYIRLNNILSLYKQTFVTPITFPPFLRDARIDDFANLLQTLENMTLLLRSLLLLKEKEFQAFFIQAKIDARNDNFTNDISTFIESALSRTRRQIVLDRVFIDHPTHPTLLTSPDAIDQEVNEHFQNFVPITSTPPSSIQDLPERWSNAYAPLADVSPAIFDSLMDPPTLDEWSSTISFMPNDKAPGPSMISQATVFPIPKPHEWKCQLKNTRPITLLEVIRKALVKLFYNRLALLLASYHVLQGGNFAGLPGGSCRDPIITLESIIHDSVVTKQPLWILSQDISKAFDSVDLSMLRFALQRLRLPQNAIQFLLSLFMSRSNRVITAHGPTPPYRVRIGIDQGEVISPLLWIIYLDPLLTVLKNEKKDPYRLVSPIASCTVLSDSCSLDVLEINNLVFMDDSTLISSSKEGMEHMLSITEEFYCLNNTSANHNKYVLATNAVAASRDLSPIAFNLSISSLNSTPNIIVTPIPMSSSFRFLGVWFNINGSRNFIRQQLK